MLMRKHYSKGRKRLKALPWKAWKPVRGRRQVVGLGIQPWASASLSQSRGSAA